MPYKKGSYVLKTKEGDKRRNNLNNFGDKRSVGRPKGSKNKISLTIKDDILTVYEKLGGVKGLHKWCKDNPSHLSMFYKSMFSLLPKDINIDTNVTHSLTKLSDADLLEIISRGSKLTKEIIDINGNEKRMLTEGEVEGGGSEGSSL